MRSGASTVGHPHCAGCRHLHVCLTPVHQERIILATHSVDTSVAHTHLKRTTPAHPEESLQASRLKPPAVRMASSTRPIDLASQEAAKSMGPCGVHVLTNDTQAIHGGLGWIARQGRGSQFWEELNWGKSEQTFQSCRKTLK